MSSRSEGWLGQLRGSGRSGDYALEVGYGRLCPVAPVRGVGEWPQEMRPGAAPALGLCPIRYEGGGLIHWS